MGKNIILSIICVLLLGSVSADAYAFEKMHKKGPGSSKFIKKFNRILAAKEQLKLSNAQLVKIEEEKLSAQKAVIRANAEIDIIALDIKKGLKKNKINIKLMNKLLDQKYEVKKNKIKRLIGAYATIKEILNKDQKKILAEIVQSTKDGKYSNSFKAHGKTRCPYPNTGK